MKRIVRGLYKRDGKVRKVTKGVCRACNLPQRVESREWAWAIKPKCIACGGMLDRKGAWRAGVDVQMVLSPDMIRPPEGETEFEVQAWLWYELRRLGVNARGCVGTDAGDCFDLVVFDAEGKPQCVVEIKKDHDVVNSTRNKKQLDRYRMYGVPVVPVHGMRAAEEFCHRYA